MNPLIVVHNNFDPGFPNAYHSMRFGYLHGFQNIGLEPRFVRHTDIISTEIDNPVFLLTWDDYNHLDDEALGLVKNKPHVVMVNPWFTGMESIPTLYGAPKPKITMNIITRIIQNEPTFVWGLDPEPLMEYYEKWARYCNVVSLPWACDTTRYHPSSAGTDFKDVEIGFVGSYRTYKKPQYEDYLWPYDDRLKIWAHSEWPRNYQGQIAIEDTKLLYQNATVCPTISEPLLPELWITPERPFAILGSGGLTVLDCNPSFKYFFDGDDVLMPAILEIYHDMMDLMLRNDDLNRLYRTRGYAAVMKGHTFAHRARKLLDNL